jgi:DNA polymerase-1
MGLPEVQSRWGIQNPGQVVDVLALMGDASDNIPGVPGIGEKTAMKLIAQFASLDNLLAHAGELTGRVKQTLESGSELPFFRSEYQGEDGRLSTRRLSIRSARRHGDVSRCSE